MKLSAATMFSFLLCCQLLTAVELVQVDGLLFEIGTLDNGAKTFMNRAYTWENVPEFLRGWQFTRLHGGVRGKVWATPGADGRLHLACSGGGADLKGWRLERESVFNYTDSDRTKVRLFSKLVQAGERVAIPQGGWTGCMLIAPKITGGASEPKPDHSKVPGVVISLLGNLLQ